MNELRKLALLVLISALLSISLSVSQGVENNAADLMRHSDGLQSNSPLHHDEENTKIRREMREIETSDYGDPKANVNPRTGPLFNPPTPTPPPSH